MPHALVTGTSSGLGQLAAGELVRRGWSVTGTMRDPSRAAGESWETLPLDLANQATIDAVGRHIADRYGSLDALVSNAGYAMIGPWEEMSSSELRRQLEVNLVGTMALVRTCLPMLRGVHGVIVQVSSISGQMSSELFGAYSASKFGLEGASEALAREVEPQGVRVVLVEPGSFRTAIVDGVPKMAGRGSSGLYEELWREQDDWYEWFRREAPDPRVAAEAIVAAVSMPGAPFRLPVGDDTGDEIREHAEAIIDDVAKANEFLAAFRAVG
jgi:NAD(P)-dependent dehydrogenase (short-subunit alcohol dehydrogenase family)